MALSRPEVQVRPRPARTGGPKREGNPLIGRVLAFAALLLLSALILYPALWMVSTSLKPDQQVFAYPPRWIPDPVQWGNYARAWASAPFSRYAVNSLLYASSVTFGTVLSCSLAAYGFSKLRFPGRNLLFTVMLSTMMIPGLVTLVPQYVLFSKLGWVGSYLPLVVPSFCAGAFFTFMLRQYFMGIPNELLEAARVDGASELWIWARVVLPLATPALATVAIFTFDGTWNDYVNPLLYLNDEKLYTLQVGLKFFQDANSVQWQLLMAASVMVLLPVVVIFFVFQKYFIEGASLTGSVKG
ncbi:carbohydrate ABC transporter permease [Deinococcus hopiensis]|uniref:Carbohydrate ABC transporter membrane protein 2, CUT1 family n=1 Tax=Deinococcus hopiensis KR-140 TaxID=695939 RepID=A0A1W1UGE7_9DEIO|nr:carbohydrate ABC transporter permease [Deinococcus hopiensis]SMB80157.1 carbohydrate ABC transporter membrane protein 2, CUT1 family [Deinococcus hopiensis KR-140]